ncbi:MAG: RNA-binding protein [Bradyrhizobiaceae bacterium]|nr:MAG: RNA-binding protein [Bradyrhizobiaceae bacterium]
MPRGPNDEKRPGDVIGAAVMVGRIATGDIKEGSTPESKAAATLGRRGGKARAAALSPEQRAKIARAAASPCACQCAGSRG